jgi:hypothetical protein
MTILESSVGYPTAPESSKSAVSWGAIIAGAVVATAVSLLMVLLGSGLGLAVVSPWSGNGVSATTFAVSTAIWIVVVQWVASIFGGYITGRLRTKWVDVHTDEVFFRDTAHGFVAWCLSTLLVAGILSSALTGLVSGGLSATTSVLSGAAQGATQVAGDKASSLSDPSGYFIDTLFRPSQPPAPAAAGSDPAAARSEVTRLLANDLASGEVPAADKTYLAQLVSSRTGLPQADAEKRVNDVLAQIDAAKTKAKEAADAARKAGTTLTLLTFLSLLIGAFIASVSAAIGGRIRDEDVPNVT